MIRYLLGLYGYKKIPPAAVQLSIKQEQIFKKLIKIRPEAKEVFEIYLKNQKALTGFLSDGRII